MSKLKLKHKDHLDGCTAWTPSRDRIQETDCTMHIEEPGAWDGILNDTLNERGNDYGFFADNSSYAQAIKCVLESSPNWIKMQPYQREALDFTASKIGRLLSGNPDKIDTWHDIAGYMQLVETNLKGVKR